jgi:AcrR family transcriptional regulator
VAHVSGDLDSQHPSDPLARARLGRDRNRLIEAAALALHADPQATLSNMAAVAGQSSQTALRLFADRDTLIAAVRGRALDAIERELERCLFAPGDALPALQQLTVGIITSARAWALLPPEVWFQDADARTNERHARIEQALDTFLTKAIWRRELRAGISVDDARAVIRQTLAEGASTAATRQVSLDAASTTAVAALTAALAPDHRGDSGPQAA